MKFLLLCLFLTTYGQAQTTPVDCPPGMDPAEALKQKIKLPSPEFKHRGYISPAELNLYSSRELAEKLVARIHRECDEVRGTKDGKPLADDSDIMMFVPSAALDAISKNGFQNQHVTRTTKGANTRDSRYDAEIQFPGMVMGYGPKSRELLPKYAALNVVRKENIGHTISPDAYGDVVMVMKPEVKKRTTWTKEDSLGVQAFRGSKLTSTLKFKDGKGLFKCMSYCEAQVWGELTLNDVEYAMIKPGAAIPPALKEKGIPVYYSQPDESSVKIKKGELATSEATVPAALPLAGPSKISERLEMQKIVPQLSALDLKEKYKDTFDVEAKRLLLGQAAQSSSPESKHFLMEAMSYVSDPLSRSQILLGLSAYGQDEKVRNIFRKFLENATPESASDAGLGFIYSSASSVDILTALSIIADTEGFSEDQDLRQKVKTLSERMPSAKEWYDRLYENKALCPEYDEAKDPVKNAFPLGGEGMMLGSGGGVIKRTIYCDDKDVCREATWGSKGETVIVSPAPSTKTEDTKAPESVP